MQFTNRRRRHFVFAVVLCLFAAKTAAGATYYVDAAAGNDANDGIAAPWKTIQKAFNSAQPGSTVYIRGGTYRERLTLNVSGSASAGYINFMNYGSDVVTLDATGITASPLIGISNKRYVRIQGLRLQNYITDAGMGISINGGSDNVEIRGNRLTNFRIAAGTTADVIARGVHAWNIPIRITGNDPTRPNDRIIIDGNEITNCEEGWAETLTVTGNSTNWEITNNKISYCQKGIDAAGHFGKSSNPATDQARNGVIRGNEMRNMGLGVGVYVDGARDLVIERNTISGIADSWGIVISCEHAGKTASGIIVRNNLIYDNAGGITVGGWIASYGRVVNSQVLNNTMVGNGTGMNLTLSSGITFKNNIVSGSNTALVNMAGNDNSSPFDFNIYHGGGISWKGAWYGTLSAYRTATGQDAQSLAVDPLFVGASGKNFHLTASSPAVNRGDPSFGAAAQEQDIDGQSRIAGGRVDIGVDEFASSGPTPPAAPTNLRITP